MIQARILAVGALFLAAVTLLGQLGEPVKPITPAEARKSIGTNAVVVGQVVEVHQTPKVASLNFEQKYPRQEFSAVVFEGNFRLFTNLGPHTPVGRSIPWRLARLAPSPPPALDPVRWRR